MNVKRILVVGAAVIGFTVAPLSLGIGSVAHADHGGDCLDGVDNDGDGLLDLADPQCRGAGGGSLLYQEQGGTRAAGQCDAADDKIVVGRTELDIGTSPSAAETGTISGPVHDVGEQVLWYARAVPLVYPEQNVHAINCVVVVGTLKR